MSADKLRERTQVSIEFGILIQPYQVLADASPPPPLVDYRLARAQVEFGKVAWFKRVHQLCQYDEVPLAIENSEICESVNHLNRKINEIVTRDENASKSQTRLRTLLSSAKTEFESCIANVPLNIPSTLSQANTPFTTHLRLADLFRIARIQITYFDRYLHPDFFTLYLRDLPRSLQVCLVTTASRNDFGVVNVLPFARLAAREFTGFRLVQVTPEDLHDRHLLLDDSHYTLGTSIKDAGRYPTTIACADPSDAAKQTLYAIIVSGSEVDLT